MKKRSCLFAYFCACVSALVLLMCVFPSTALADEEYTSTTMRLLHYKGTDRTIDALRGREDGSPEELVGAVLDAVEAFVADAPQFDDLTMLCVEYR